MSDLVLNCIFSDAVGLAVPFPYGPSSSLPGECFHKNLSSVTNDSFCYKLPNSLLLIGYQQICH